MTEKLLIPITVAGCVWLANYQGWIQTVIELLVIFGFVGFVEFARWMRK